MQSTCSSLSEERKASNSYKAMVNNLLHKKDDSVKVYKEKFYEKFLTAEYFNFLIALQLFLTFWYAIIKGVTIMMTSYDYNCKIIVLLYLIDNIIAH
jgi:hypothetical protein